MIRFIFNIFKEIIKFIISLFTSIYNFIHNRIEKSKENDLEYLQSFKRNRKILKSNEVVLCCQDCGIIYPIEHSINCSACGNVMRTYLSAQIKIEKDNNENSDKIAKNYVNQYLKNAGIDVEQIEEKHPSETIKEPKLCYFSIEKEITDEECNNLINDMAKSDITFSKKLYSGLQNKDLKASSKKVYLIKDKIPCFLSFNEFKKRYEIFSENKKYYFGYLLDGDTEKIKDLINDYNTKQFIDISGGKSKEWDFVNEKIISNIVPYTLELMIYYIDKTESFNNKFKSKLTAYTDDPLYDEVYKFALETGKISASLIQRRFRLGYNRAAKLIELLEEKGAIGPQNGSKPREILIKK